MVLQMVVCYRFVNVQIEVSPKNFEQPDTVLMHYQCLSPEELIKHYVWQYSSADWILVYMEPTNAILKKTYLED